MRYILLGSFLAFAAATKAMPTGYTSAASHGVEARMPPKTNTSSNGTKGSGAVGNGKKTHVLLRAPSEGEDGLEARMPPKTNSSSNGTKGSGAAGSGKPGTKTPTRDSEA